jgi:hypothetical protein
MQTSLILSCCQTGLTMVFVEPQIKIEETYSKQSNNKKQKQKQKQKLTFNSELLLIVFTLATLACKSWRSPCFPRCLYRIFICGPFLVRRGPCFSIRFYSYLNTNKKNASCP